MHQFVWARAFCGLSVGCCASVDRSGAIRKIHVVEIHVSQGVAHACYHDGFQHLETFDEAPGTVQSPGVRADAQCCKIYLRAGTPTRPPGLATLLVSFKDCSMFFW